MSFVDKREEGNCTKNANIVLVGSNINLVGNLKKNHIKLAGLRGSELSENSPDPPSSSLSPLHHNHFLTGSTDIEYKSNANNSNIANIESTDFYNADQISQKNLRNINNSNNNNNIINNNNNNNFNNNNNNNNNFNNNNNNFNNNNNSNRNTFVSAGLGAETELKNDFRAAGDQQESLRELFDRPINQNSTKLIRPSTLQVTSCLDNDLQVMASKHDTPDDINEFLEEGFQLITCQEKICDLYVRLHEPGSEEMLATFGSIIISFIEDIKVVVADKVRLGQLYERERDEHMAKVKRMEDEIEGQMRAVEAKIRSEESKKFKAMDKEWKSRHFEEINSLHFEVERLKINAAKTKLTHDTTGRLEEELKESRLKNEQLQSSLDDHVKNFSSLETELGVVKSKLVEKEGELVRRKKLSKEDSIEIDNLISQIEVLQTSNKTLHEKTEDLCEALRICRSYYKTQMKQKSALAKDDFIQKYLDESCGSFNRALSREQQLSEIKSNKTYSSGFGEDEDLDSSGVDELENLNSPSDYFHLGNSLNHNNNNSNNNSNNNNLNTLHLNTSNNLNSNNNIFSNSPAISSCHVLSQNLHPLSNSLDRRTCTRLHSLNNNNNNLSNSELNAYQDPERIFKIVLAGDAAVGKSSFIVRLCKNKFVSTLSSTVGVDFQTKTFRVDGKVIALQIWDTAGQERFRSMAKSYFRRADGVLLLYDITYEHSFLSVRDWLETIQDGAQKNIPIMIVGNKSDLRVGEAKSSCVKTEHGMDLARDENCLFVEASAKSGENIQDAVVELTRSLMAMEDLEVQTAGLKLNEDGVKKKSCCG